MTAHSIPFKTTDELLTEREKTHGDFGVFAECTQQIKNAFANRAGWGNLNDCQREALDMIAHKIGRILVGDPNFRDHWDDIAGYAKLVADRCPK
jgi:hypothetical protein